MYNISSRRIFGVAADLAHSVERDLAKVEVAGSSPVIRSKNKKNVYIRNNLLYAFFSFAQKYTPGLNILKIFI